MNLDKSRKNLTADECFFLLNNERYLNLDGSKKGSLGETGPAVANRPACEIEFPKGDNYIVGKYYSKLTNELYYWNWNSNGVHFISRINGNGVCQIVYSGSCLKLNANPRHSIEQFRAYMQVDKLCANRHGKALIWTDGENPIGMIDVEASIETDYFSTPFFDRCDEGCQVIEMCVPDPCGCLYGEFVPLSEEDRGKKNDVVDVGIQFSYRHVYYDDRASIWADPSKLFYQDTKGCFDNADGFPRCIKLRIPVGGPMVDKIEIAFIKNGVWYRTEIVEKYKKYNSSQQYWYERGLAELDNYSDSDCSFDYYFCHDKLCEVIDPSEYNRVFNPMPIKPQGILPIGIGEDRTALGFFNYEQGSCPIDKTEVDKVSIGIDCPETNCEVQYAKIKVRLIIHNRAHDRNQFVYREGGTAGGPDDTSDKAYFGGLNPALSGGHELGYDQYFNGKTRNFIAYVEGTEAWAEMKQHKSHAYYTNTEFWGIVNDMDDVQTRNRWRRATRNGEYFYQEAEIKVIKGTRGFLRIASHHSTSGSGTNQDTSTFVIGTQHLTHYKGDIALGDGYTDGKEEIYFDTCNGDVDITEAFVVDDNAVDAGIANKAVGFYGYIKDKSGRPVEGAIVEDSWGEESWVTDHNGFYHFYIAPDVFPGDVPPVTINVRVEQDCWNFTVGMSETVQGASGENTRHDITIGSEAYDAGFYALVKLLVQDCNGFPIGGVRVALSGSKYDVTDAEGIARFRIRNYEARNRDIRYVVMNDKGCFGTDCNEVCNPCMPTGSASTPDCYLSKPTITFSSAVVNRNYSLNTSQGLKRGGRFPFAFVVKGDCGMQSPAYLTNYLDIPRVQENGREGFCRHTYTATGITLPSWAKCVDIVRGVNVNPFELQWIVDKIERVDGKIKLTIQSLNDYNEKYGFKSNTVYQWLKGDRIEFIKNGDGKIFTISQYGLLNYLTISPFHDEIISGKEEADANYFNQVLIDDDGKLDGLTEGAVIEMQRTKECATEPEFRSICVSIPVVNGKLLYESGEFETFDSYLVKRTIGNRATQTFEHHSPSDFWGEKISDLGRPYFMNKYENKRRYGRNITINAPTVFNYFGDLVKTLNPDGHGDIVAMILNDNKVGLCISEHDNSLFEVGDDLLKVGSDGIVRVAGPDSVISDSQSKISGTYGCQYDHIGSVYFGDGWATWVDVNKHTFVKHDYQIAKPADEGQAQTYFRRICQELESYNRTTTDPLYKRRFCTGMNNHTAALYITVKALKDPGIYNEKAPFLKTYSTIGYHPIGEDFLGFFSFVPEAYGQLNLFDGDGSAFVAFLNGVPFIHPVIPDKWNEFFGETVDRVVGISMNKFPEKIKKGIAIEVQDETMWFVSDVSTESVNFKSEIPPVKWAKDRNKWNAAFLRNINSIGGLYNGKEASGYYHAVTFVRDNTINNHYGTIDHSKRTKYDSLDMIHFKFRLEEQAGFTENV